MEFLVMVVLLAGGGMFAYRQVMAIREESRPRPRFERAARTVFSAPEEDAHFYVDTVVLPPPHAAASKSPRFNKWLLLLGAVIYLVNPLDFDFIPVVGWIDDAVVMALAIRNVLKKP